MHLKVCFLIPRLPIGKSGILVGSCAANCVCLAHELRRQGVQIEIISPVLKENWEFLAGHALGNIIRPVPIGGFGIIGRGIASLWLLRRSLKELMRKMNYNVVHSHSGTYPYALAALAANQKRCVRVHSLYCPVGAEGGVYSHWWEKPIAAGFIFNRLDKTIAVTENIYRSIACAGVARNKLHFLPISVDNRRFCPTINWGQNKYFPNDPDAIKIFFVGNASKEKGLLELLNAARLLLEQEIKLNVVAAIENQSNIRQYSDMENYAEWYIGRFGIAENVRLIGLVEKIEELYAESDIIIIPWNTSRGPSDYPMVVLEGMAMGKCVVSTPVGGCPELLEHGKAGILAEGFTSEAIASAIKFAIEHPEVRKQVGQRALVASERFSLEAVGKQMINLYEHLLTAKQLVPNEE